MPIPVGRRDYELSPDTMVDARRELGGVRVKTIAGKRIVRMSDRQAKWFLEHAAIMPLGTIAGGGEVSRPDTPAP